MTGSKEAEEMNITPNELRMKAAVLSSRGKSNTLHDIEQAAEYMRRAGNLLEAYEQSIQRAEATFRKNKSRMWVLTILRDYLKEERAK